MYLYLTQTILAKNILFIENTSETYDGGALYIERSDLIDLNKVNFVSNRAIKGGAFFVIILFIK